MEEKKKNQKKRRLAVLASILALLALLVGTFAWLTAKDQAKNEFLGKKVGDDVQIVEDFDPKPMIPNQEIKKEVGIMNTSDYEELIRTSFGEELRLLRDAKEYMMGEAELIALAADDAPQIAKFKTDYTLEAKKVTDENDDPVKFTINGAGALAGKTYELKAVGEKATVAGKDGFRYSLYFTDGTDKFFVKTTEPTKSVAVGTTDFNVIVKKGDPKMKVIKMKRADAILALWSINDPAKSGKWVGMASNVDKPITSVTVNADGTGVATSEVIIDGTTTPKTKAHVKIKLENMSATPVKNKWYFNKTDGEFYYVGVVKSGETTPIFMKSVTLTDEAGGIYNDLEYDLNVFAKSIQAYKDVIKTPEWLGNGAGGAVSDADLATALDGVCTLSAP